jgi:hypothetical protein
MPEIRPITRPNSRFQSRCEEDSLSLAAENVQSIAALLPQVLKRYLSAEAAEPTTTVSGQHAA